MGTALGIALALAALLDILRACQQLVGLRLEVVERGAGVQLLPALPLGIPGKT